LPNIGESANPTPRDDALRCCGRVAGGKWPQYPEVDVEERLCSRDRIGERLRQRRFCLRRVWLTNAMSAAILLSLLLAASAPLPPSFAPPKGWVEKLPPPSAPVNVIWFSPHFDVNGNGENFSVTIHPAPAGSTLHAEVHRAIDELSRDRKIVDSHSEPTCRGRQDGWTFDARIPLPNGKVVSQVYHVTIVGGRVYAFIFTHAAGDRVEREITDSIQSICPSKRSAA